MSLNEFLINGAHDLIAPSNRSLHYGDGVFETMLVEQGQPRFWHSHYQRLSRGCERIGIKIPESETLLGYIRKFDTDQASRVKLMVCRSTSDSEPLSFLWRSDLPSSIEHWQLQVCQHQLPDDPDLAGIKHNNRLHYILAQQELQQGYNEGLLLNQHEEVVEGIHTNVFFWSEGQWHTPELSRQGVAGVMREQIAKIIPQLGFKLRLGRYGLSDLYEAEEVFVCNALRGVVPIKRLNQHEYGGFAKSQQIRDKITP